MAEEINTEKCHMCGTETEFSCCECGLPVCEDCCVVPTYMNQIDYTMCLDCGDMRDSDREDEICREWESEERSSAEKEKKSIARKANYWKPENVAKRALKKKELAKKRREEDQRRIKELGNIIGDVFRGMF